MSGLKMKVLVLKPFLVSRSNGGEISLLERLEVLKASGWEISLQVGLPRSQEEWSRRFLAERGSPLNEKGVYTIGRLEIQTHFDERFHPYELAAQNPMENFFWSKIDQEKPDFVVAHYTDFFAMSAAIKWDAKRAFILQTDDEFPRFEKLKDFPSVLACAKRIRNFVVNSAFLKESVRKAFPEAPAVLQIPNPIRIQKIAEPTQRNYWLFVNPTPVKGVEFMQKLAAALPSENFLFVGNWTTKRPERMPKNIQWIERQESIYPIFEKAKGLLMPSVWNEAFGRLALEAMQAHVPVIASDRGALPSTIGRGGLTLPLELSQWKAQILQADKAWIDRYAARGHERFQEYRRDTEHRFKALNRFAKHLIK